MARNAHSRAVCIAYTDGLPRLYTSRLNPMYLLSLNVYLRNYRLKYNISDTFTYGFKSSYPLHPDTLMSRFYENTVLTQYIQWQIIYCINTVYCYRANSVYDNNYYLTNFTTSQRMYTYSYTRFYSGARENQGRPKLSSQRRTADEKKKSKRTIFGLLHNEEYCILLEVITYINRKH